MCFRQKEKSGKLIVVYSRITRNTHTQNVCEKNSESLNVSDSTYTYHRALNG